MKAFNVDTYEQIEDFLTGNLPEPAAAEARRRMELDPAFASEVAFIKFLLAGKEVKKPVQALLAFERYHRRSTLKIRLVRVAVAIIGLLVLVFLAVLLFGKETNQMKPDDPSKPADSTGIQLELPLDTPLQNPPTPVATDTPSQSPVTAGTSSPPVAERKSTAQPWENEVIFRQGMTELSDSEDEQLQKALQEMDAGNRKEALPVLVKHLASLPAGEDDFQLRMEVAKAYLQERQPVEADFHLQKILSSDAVELLKIEATFYVAIKDWSVGNHDSSRKSLETLAEKAPKFWREKSARALEHLPKSK